MAHVALQGVEAEVRKAGGVRCTAGVPVRGGPGGAARSLTHNTGRLKQTTKVRGKEVSFMEKLLPHHREGAN